MRFNILTCNLKYTSARWRLPWPVSTATGNARALPQALMFYNYMSYCSVASLVKCTPGKHMWPHTIVWGLYNPHHLACSGLGMDHKFHKVADPLKVIKLSRLHAYALRVYRDHVPSSTTSHEAARHADKNILVKSCACRDSSAAFVCRILPFTWSQYANV